MTDNDRDRCPLRVADRIEGTMKWLRNRGYIGAHVPATPESFAHDVLLFGRPGEPARLAVVGSTLVWDGHDVTVEEA